MPPFLIFCLYFGMYLSLFQRAFRFQSHFVCPILRKKKSNLNTYLVLVSSIHSSNGGIFLLHSLLSYSWWLIHASRFLLLPCLGVHVSVINIVLSVYNSNPLNQDFAHYFKEEFKKEFHIFIGKSNKS